MNSEQVKSLVSTISIEALEAEVERRRAAMGDMTDREQHAAIREHACQYRLVYIAGVPLMLTHVVTTPTTYDDSRFAVRVEAETVHLVATAQGKPTVESTEDEHALLRGELRVP